MHISSLTLRLAEHLAQAKAITDLTASLESERKRRQNLEIEVEKIKQQLDEQKQRFEKQVRPQARTHEVDENGPVANERLQIDDLLARNRNVIRDASEAAAKAHEDLKSSTAASQKALEAAKAAVRAHSL